MTPMLWRILNLPMVMPIPMAAKPRRHKCHDDIVGICRAPEKMKLVSDENIKCVLKIIESGANTRREVMQKSGLSKATISVAVRILADQGSIEQTKVGKRQLVLKVKEL